MSPPVTILVELVVKGLDEIAVPPNGSKAVQLLGFESEVL